MAVFRVEKTRDFTVMSNHHLRNTSLSLKGKGLLSLMLSLPECWDYTTRGLACICKDGVDSICSTLNELEKHGYLTRERLRDKHGRLGDIEYTIHEQPIGVPSPEKPDTKPNPPKRDFPDQVNPDQVKPDMEKPGQVFPVQLNKDLSNIENKSNTHGLKIYPSIPAGHTADGMDGIDERKARARRLIERGAILESLIDGAAALTNEEIKAILERSLSTKAAAGNLSKPPQQTSEG